MPIRGRPSASSRGFRGDSTEYTAVTPCSIPRSRRPLRTSFASGQTFVCARSAQRIAAVRSSLAPWMWLEKWEPGRITVRYWKDSDKTSSGKTPGELVVDKLKGKTAVVDPASVKISDMSAIGKDGQVAQFTVELKFK